MIPNLEQLEALISRLERHLRMKDLKGVIVMSEIDVRDDRDITDDIVELIKAVKELCPTLSNSKRP